ncbi:MAG: HDOD domain-containing protein [Ghiorsea sp.]
MNKKEQLHQTTMEMLSISLDIPTLPDRFLNIQNVINDTSSTLGDLTKVVETDQATAAALVKIANSTAYNPYGNPVSSLSYAISRLGREQTVSIALSMSLLYGFSMPAGIAVIRRFWAHAFAVGQVSRFLVSLTNDRHQLDTDTLFLTGLLHDIGRALLGIRIDPNYFESELSHLKGDQLIEAEIAAYGMGHAEAGACILKIWGFPQSIYDVIEIHHDHPTESVSTAICSLACAIVHQQLPNVASIEEVETQLHGTFFEDAINHPDISENPLFSFITN